MFSVIIPDKASRLQSLSYYYNIASLYNINTFIVVLWSSPLWYRDFMNLNAVPDRQLGLTISLLNLLVANIRSLLIVSSIAILPVELSSGYVLFCQLGCLKNQTQCQPPSSISPNSGLLLSSLPNNDFSVSFTLSNPLHLNNIITLLGVN